ncbi:MAG: phosphoglucosamine mutase [Actinobacteria bacterium]|nr:phosphoglucosamine mutase [Actinomycetota bacterium]
MARRYFGTDGVRGLVGHDLTPELVERLGRAAALWAGGGRVLVGRDTRGSGPELEAALARGIVSVGADAVLGGVLPTPAVALFALDLGAVLSASHNPPEYNGVKLFDRDGRKLSDADEETIEALLDRPAEGEPGAVDRLEGAAERYAEHVVEHFGSDLSGLRLAVDCANGALSTIAPAVLTRLGADVTALADAPDGTNINVGCGATDLALLRRTVREGSFDLGVAFDGDGDRMLAVDSAGEVVDGDGILAILALHLRARLVAVTTMTNLGFHRLMAEHGIRVVTTDVGDRYVLEALRREGGSLGGEQSGHLISLAGHVTGDGLAAALLLCRALEGRPLAELAAPLERYPQRTENVRVRSKQLPDSVLGEVALVNAQLDGLGRVLVRPSGTEPLVRVLAEAPTPEEAERLCARVAALVRRELG